ncbi:MAG: DNA-processing protein DprA [Rhodobacter sp.]|nr:DNA-processing protein DprA [Rhodobacter sp.]
MAEDILPSPHPLTPPRSEDDWLSWLRLLRSRRVGPTTFFRLMAEHGGAAAALEALPGVALAAGVSDYTSCPAEAAAAEMKAGRLAGARLVAYGGVDYPAPLMDLPDAPPLLWVLGDTGLLTRPMVALVGARNASSLGTRMARKLAEGLTDKGFVVVSGLARGVDTAAHLAALRGGTCAVMAGGVDVVYPVENAVLAQEIAENGLRISEQAMGLQPQARHFPTRNRLISGIAGAVVVVEAAAKSGSLITAKNALDQGRDVLAVPGHPFDARASGCNLLIRDGAVLVRSVEDVVEAISPPPAQAEMALEDTPAAAPASPPETRTLQETARLHSEILSRLGPSPVAEDQLIRDLKQPANTIAPELVALELEGKIARQAGGLLSLA